MTSDMFRKLLEDGEISKYDIKDMFNKGEISIDELIDLLRRYAKFMSNVKSIIF